MRKASFDEVDAALLKWFTHMRTTRPAFPIRGAILLSKANDFAEMYGYDRQIDLDGNCIMTYHLSLFMEKRLQLI